MKKGWWWYIFRENPTGVWTNKNYGPYSLFNYKRGFLRRVLAAYFKHPLFRLYNPQVTQAYWDYLRTIFADTFDGDSDPDNLRGIPPFVLLMNIALFGVRDFDFSTGVPASDYCSTSASEKSRLADKGWHQVFLFIFLCAYDLEWTFDENNHAAHMALLGYFMPRNSNPLHMWFTEPRFNQEMKECNRNHFEAGSDALFQAVDDYKLEAGDDASWSGFLHYRYWLRLNGGAVDEPNCGGHGLVGARRRCIRMEREEMLSWARIRALQHGVQFTSNQVQHFYPNVQQGIRAGPWPKQRVIAHFCLGGIPKPDWYKDYTEAFVAKACTKIQPVMKAEFPPARDLTHAQDLARRREDVIMVDEDEDYSTPLPILPAPLPFQPRDPEPNVDALFRMVDFLYKFPSQ